ncbi:MAG: tryptophan-rich sensory protein [Patescibacteria group bacterium]
MKNIFIKIITVVTYVSMLVVNFLANSLPINNRSTGQISDAYPNLFAPAGLTFSIWGLIYLLLAFYIVYQFLRVNSKRSDLFNKINLLFIITSIANILWIFAWHYDYIGLSVIVMAILLFCLIKIADIVRLQKFSSLEKFFILIPFSVYFGWITVAAIANITVFLVSINWNGFGIAEYIWTSIVLLVGALIGILRMCKDKNTAYGLVFVWAYLGILLKHLSVTGFNGKYLSIIVTLVLCLVLFMFFVGRIFYKNKQ